MVRTFWLIFILTISIALAVTQLEKLSTEDALQVIALMDKVDFLNCTNATTEIFKLTGLNYEPHNFTMRQLLRDAIESNIHHTSFYAKVLGLITFANIISVLMVPIGLVFLFSFFGDVILRLASVFGGVIIRLLMNRQLVYAMLLGFTSPLLYFKYDDNHYITKFFILGWATPLFGCFLLGITMVAMYLDISIYSFVNNDGQNFGEQQFQDKLPHLVKIVDLMGVIWSAMAVYHDNWLIGVAVVMLIFFRNGFIYGSFTGGIYLGFSDEDRVSRCLETAIILNLITLFFKVMSENPTVQLLVKVFETGVFFWAAFVGGLAFLISSHDWYLRSKLKEKYTSESYTLYNFFMVVYCIGLMYLGNVMYINSYKNIGGTFLVLWGIGIEHKIWNTLGTSGMTIATGVILANLYIIRELMMRFPEYCIV